MRKKNMGLIIRLFAVASLLPGTWLLAGCGFHLRGEVTLPKAMARTEIRGIEFHSPLGETIADVLADAGAQAVDTGEGGSASLAISGESFGRRVSSVDSTGKATQYELRYTLAGSLLDHAAKVLVPPQNVLVIRILNFDSANVLGSTSEEELLRSEMRRDGVHQLIRQVRTALDRRSRVQ
jgi:LPS-assembly lipoprotein